jgi:hypothetical protein
MLLDIATLIALVLGFLLVRCGQRKRLDSHPERGLSFLQLGLRYLQQLRHLGQPLPGSVLDLWNNYQTARPNS